MPDDNRFLPEWISAAEWGASFWWLVLTVVLAISQYALRRYAEGQHDSVLIRIARMTIRPFFAIACLLLAQSAVPLIPFPPMQVLIGHLVKVLLIIAVTWWIIVAANAAKDAVLRKYDLTAADNYHARQVHTRLRVLYRIALFFTIVIAGAFVLMTFEAVRAVGTSLLAGAGITGIILGLAAQKTLGSIFAGIQIAMTQPIKVDDAVVIEGEWGWIEEITLTYVVVKVWDLRRLIVPITYFIDHPFQNWTRREAEIIGQVVLYTDYHVPLDRLRAELTRLLENDTRWNRKVNVLQVIEANERSITLRALMSSYDSPQAWDLRCAVREGLIAWLREHCPDALPRTRVEVEPLHSGLENHQVKHHHNGGESKGAVSHPPAV